MNLVTFLKSILVSLQHYFSSIEIIVALKMAIFIAYSYTFEG